MGVGRPKWLLLGLRTIVALAFTAAALAKMAGLPELVAVYERIGIGQWFRYATVAVEAVGVVCILRRNYVSLGALLLAMTMFVAALLCVFILHSSPVPALVLGGLCAALAYTTREQLIPLINSVAGNMR